MSPLRRHPSAASTIAKLLHNDPKRIALLVAVVCALWGVMWRYEVALSRATEYHETRRLVYGGLAVIGVAALALAAALWRIGSAAVSQEIFPPPTRLAPLLLIPPGNAELTGRAAVRRGRLLMALACGICLWVIVVMLLMQHIEESLIRARDQKVRAVALTEARSHSQRSVRVSAFLPRARHSAPPPS